MPPVVLQPNALPDDAFEALRARVLGSPLVGRSTLAGSFRASRGFAITFRRDALPEVTRRFQPAAPFLELAMRRRSGVRLQPWWRRFGRRPEPNAFYLNVLVVPAGAAVGRHTDGTLRGPTGDETALPQQVTVLYLQVPTTMAGGELSLHDAGRELSRVTPAENTLVRFRGDLAHEVRTVTRQEGDARPQVRASIVLEQYCLNDAALSRLQPIHIQSNAGFAAFLEDAEASRPLPDFIAD